VAIADIQMGDLQQRLAEQCMRLEVTDAAKGWLADQGYDPAFGARPLRRTIQRFVESPLSQRLLEGAFKAGDTVRVDLDPDGEALIFTTIAEEPDADEACRVESEAAQVVEGLSASDGADG
jgi:ATP-dependent Clp protease ATP-binding subunit ClpA